MKSERIFETSLLVLERIRARFASSRAKYTQDSRSLGRFLGAFLAMIFMAGAAYAYPVATIKNNTDYTLSGKVEYISFLCSDDGYTVGPGKTWSASSRGACLIDAITGRVHEPAKHGEKTSVVSYSSTGTSYSKFQINAYSGSYRIFSEDEYKDVTDTKHDKSPGFYFINKTAWPLLYSLDQVGCLYHDIIPTGSAGQPGLRKVDTGAVWFTLRVRIQPDGVNPDSDWACVKPVAELVADVGLAAVSGGSTAAAKAGGKIVIKTVLKAAIKEGAKKAVKKAGTKILKDLAKDELGKILSDAGSVEMYGQYAGYEWPFRCDKMPAYEITGGPEPLRDEDGELYLSRGQPFTVTKINSCGNDMMTGSKKSMSSDQSSFSSWGPSPAAVSASAAQTDRISPAELQKRQDQVNASNAAIKAKADANAAKNYANCSRRGNIQSLNQPGAVANNIAMFNTGSRDIQVYWINFQGQEVNYASQDAPIMQIAAGPTGYNDPGAPGYWYIAVDQNGECVGIASPSESGNEVHFNPDQVVPGIHPQKAAQGYVDQGYVDQGYVDQGYVDQGYVDQGYVDQGYVDQGYVDQGYVDQGYVDQGYVDQGYVDQGYVDQGYVDQGYVDQGYVDDGYDNQGYDDEEY
jgi:hypothetical protein